MARPPTRRQALENARFLAALRRTGNARLAALELGVHRSTYTKRRARDPAFASAWEAALVAAHADLVRPGAEFLPGTGRGTVRRAVEGPAATRAESVPSRSAGSPPAKRSGRKAALRTEGGELRPARFARSGRLQLRRVPAGRMTRAAEQAFLRALAACANVRLAAAATGFAHSSFYAKRRARRGFAREMRLALAEGYDRVEAAALAAALPESHEDDGWRHNDPLPVPPMTAGQALQLLFLHEKSVRQGWDRPHRRRRRGEPWEVYVERLRAMWAAEQARAAEDQALRRLAAAEPADDSAPGDGEDGPALPSLDQVTGWSKADPSRPPHDPDRALFGGWRLKHRKKGEKR